MVDVSGFKIFVSLKDRNPHLESFSGYVKSEIRKKRLVSFILCKILQLNGETLAKI